MSAACHTVGPGQTEKTLIDAGKLGRVILIQPESSARLCVPGALLKAARSSQHLALRCTTYPVLADVVAQAHKTPKSAVSWAAHRLCS